MGGAQVNIASTEVAAEPVGTAEVFKKGVGVHLAVVHHASVKEECPGPRTWKEN